MPKVSVIIPAYNPGPFLRPALLSVHQQTFTDWEVVVVDDASTEDLGWITEEFPTVRVIRQTRGGASVARNAGILATESELIAFMDQDDVWLERKLWNQVAAMNRIPNAGLCYCDLRVLNSQDLVSTSAELAVPCSRTEIALDPASPSGTSSPLLASIAHFARRFVVPSTVVLRRTCLAQTGLLDPFMPFSGDYDLLIRIGSEHVVIHVLSTDVLYRKHDDNFSDQYAVGRAEMRALVGRYVSVAKTRHDRELAVQASKLLRRPRRLYAAQAYDCARRSLRGRDFRKAAMHLWNAARFDPTFVARSLRDYVRNSRMQ